MKLATTKRLIIVALACLSVFAYRLVSLHIWLPLDCQILVDGKFKPADYLPVKSLNGDIFLRNQDHGTQFLISVKKKEVSVISEDEDFIDVGFLTYTHDALTNLEDSKIKQGVVEPNISVSAGVVEFTSSKGERWRISYRGAA
jgi:hypothetical protein